MTFIFVALVAVALVVAVVALALVVAAVYIISGIGQTCANDERWRPCQP